VRLEKKDKEPRMCFQQEKDLLSAGKDFVFNRKIGKVVLINAPAKLSLMRKEA